MLRFRPVMCTQCVVLFRRVNIPDGCHYSTYRPVKCDNYLEDGQTNYTPVAEFYTGKSVLLTGGTGFLGKVILEKLLHDCTELDKLYVLTREKKGMEIHERIEEIFQNVLFTRLKANKPEVLKKVVPIAGDISLPGLGIKSEDKQILMDKVSVVFHSAASVRFDEPLQVAMNINYEGTKEMMNLCKQIKNIEAFVFVSTAFAHTDKPVLEETVYPAPLPVEDVYKFIEKYENDEKKTKNLLGRRPNTYTLAKALAEAYLADNHGAVPTIILRPSIVSPIIDDHHKGWLDNWFGATTIFYNITQGLNHITLGDSKTLADLIPVDYVANMTIVAAAKLNGSRNIQVFNSCSSSENPITWSEAHSIILKESILLGKNILPFPIYFHTKSRIMVNLFTTVFQMTPAYIMDLFLKIRGKKPKYVTAMTRAVYIRDFYDYFTYNSWVMKADRSRGMTASLSPADKKLFPFDPTNIRWDEYMKNYCRGIYRYLIKNKKV